MKAVMIGNGFIGSAHRSAYRLLSEEGSDIRLEAICDIRPEKLVENDGARVYTSVDEMLATEKDIDYVDICLPTFLHAEYAVKCMKAGYNVLCEKPMALNEEQTRQMLDCSKETGKKLMIGQCCRFGADLVAIRQFVLEGSLGKPQSAFFTAADYKPTWGWDGWFQDGERSGGAMLDLQAHNVDLINWFFGLPKYVSSVGVEREDFTGFGSISGNFIYDDGLFVHSWCDWFAKSNKHNKRSIRINFEHGYLYNNRGKDHQLVAVDENGNIADLSDRVKLGPVTIRNEIEYFTTCLKNGQPFRFNMPEESAKAVRIIRAQMESCRLNGAPVEIKEDGEA